MTGPLLVVTVQPDPVRSIALTSAPRSNRAPVSPRQPQQSHHAAERIAIALSGGKIGAEHTVRQGGGEVAQFVTAEYVAFDAPASLHRRFAAQPRQTGFVLCQHQAALGADAEILAGRGGDLPSTARCCAGASGSVCAAGPPSGGVYRR